MLQITKYQLLLNGARSDVHNIFLLLGGDRWPSELCGILPQSDVAEAANSGDLELECESVKSINTDDLWHV